MRQRQHVQKMRRIPIGLTAVTIAALIGCGPSTQKATAPAGGSSTFAANPNNFKISLTDAPTDDIKSVFVNIKHAELRLAGSGKEGRLIVAKGLGSVDLLTLRDGVTLPMAEVNLPQGVEVTQIRLVLEEEGHYLVHGDERTCALQTPSQQQTGIKLIVKEPILIDTGFSYAIVVDFDAKKSIVLKGNGGCLLKPVLKLKSAVKSPIETPDDSSDDVHLPDDGEDVDLPVDSTPDEDTTPVEDSAPADDSSAENGGNETDDSAGDETQGGDWDTDDPSTLPPELTEEELEDYYNRNF